MITVLHGDCREVLASLPAESVQCCVTSPPYFGLRDYGTAQWEGGEAGCDHVAGTDRPRSSRPLGKFHGGDDKFHETPYRDLCGKCGARRIDAQIGLETTPDAYVAELVQVFREVRRVLRPNGVLFLNLGDSYASAGVRREAACDTSGKGPVGSQDYTTALLKPKDLIGIPWRVAFALQADGWWLRSDVIWAKPNPMPESVTDRPTKSHEYLFLLAKSERYYWDAEAVKEPAINGERFHGDYGKPGVLRPTSAKNGRERADNTLAERNIRSVWTIATQPYAEAHFATFPPALVVPCIKSSSRPGDTILDPFGGAGTTGLVADRLGRHAILIELNAEYAAMARSRLQRDAGMFAEVA